MALFGETDRKIVISYNYEMASETMHTVEVHVLVPTTAPADVYLVRMKYTTESGRTVWASKLIDDRGSRGNSAAMLHATFETGGPVTVNLILIDLLQPLSIGSLEVK